MMWPFRDRRPPWQKGPGYRVVIPDGTPQGEVLALWAVLFVATVREHSRDHYFWTVPLNVWMPDEEYEGLDAKVKKFLVKREARA